MVFWYYTNNPDDQLPETITHIWNTYGNHTRNNRISLWILGNYRILFYIYVSVCSNNGRRCVCYDGTFTAHSSINSELFSDICGRAENSKVFSLKNIPRRSKNEDTYNSCFSLSGFYRPNLGYMRWDCKGGLNGRNNE